MVKAKAVQILIVDSSSFMRRIIRDVLSTYGYESISEANSGTAAIQRYREFKPDLVVMEMVLSDPTMNGIETIKWLIKVESKVKILIVSALGYADLINEALSAGAKDYCLKPFEPERIIKKINALL